MQLTLLVPLIFAGAAIAQGYYSGHIIGASSVACRSCPKRSCGYSRTYHRGDIVDLRCKTSANTQTVDGDVWWIKTRDGCYIPDEYVDYPSGLPADC